MILPNSYFISQDDERGRSVVRFSAHRLSRLYPPRSTYLPTHVSPYDVMQCNAIYRKPPTHSLTRPHLANKTLLPSSLSLHVLFLQTSREEDLSHLKGKVRLGTYISRLRQQYRRVVVSELNCDSRSICGFSEYFTFVEFLEYHSRSS